MNFIAIKPFYRVAALTELGVVGKRHDDHVHVGEIVKIGLGVNIQDLTPKQVELVAQLNAAGCISEEGNARAQAFAKQFLADEKKREEKDRAIEEKNQSAAIGRAVVESLAEKV